jgi:hypothetical protein
MPFNLKLIFTGLCAFVEHTDGTRAKVLLMDGRDEITDPPLVHCCPVIRFNRTDLDPTSTRRADLCRDGVPLSSHDGLCFLDREDLKVEAVSGTLTTPFQITPTVRTNLSDPEPTEATRADWSWVAELERIKAGAGAPQSWWFDPIPTPPSPPLPHPPILARFNLDQGILSTLEFFRHPTNLRFPSVFRFNSGYRQALASFVQCEIACDSNTQVRITSTPWDGGTGRSLLFSPRTQDLTIEISNAPFFDVMQELFPVGNGWTFPPSFTQGHSFLHFYQLQPPFSTGEFPGTSNREPSTKTVNRNLTVEKGVGCSPSKTDAFAFP